MLDLLILKVLSSGWPIVTILSCAFKRPLSLDLLVCVCVCVCLRVCAHTRVPMCVLVSLLSKLLMLTAFTE